MRTQVLLGWDFDAESWTQWKQDPLFATDRLHEIRIEYTLRIGDNLHSPLVKSTLDGVIFHPPYLFTLPTLGVGGRPCGNVLSQFS